jgi:hypothetical protein
MPSRLKQIEEYQERHKNILFKVVDKLEQRIATLEKVLASHAKCIGEMRVKELSELTPDEFAKQVRFK